jgi:hypothetical protein
MSVHCSASDVWLKIYGSTGEHCYSGTGSLRVDLPGVDRFQVVGSHAGSLSAADGHYFSFVGSGTYEISPPITLSKVTLTS